jgi:hypothetical protein
MIQIGYVLSGLIALAILFLGSRFWLAPATASAAFGIADSPPPSTGLTAWLSVKGTRDFVAGLFVFLLMVNGSPRLLGEFIRRKQRRRLGHSWLYGSGHRRNWRVPHRRRQLKATKTNNFSINQERKNGDDTNVKRSNQARLPICRDHVQP